ncbi:MAG: tRNA 2-thiouridine(34) synthase MnmA, partial [Bacteroidetes bacterium HGW-Bacteroidetes-15]
PLFVLAIDVDENVVYVGQGQEHPGLFRKGLFIPESDIHWVRPDMAMKIGESKEFLVRIRYRQPLQKGKLVRESSGMFIVFEQAQRGIAAGQFAAWYLEDELIGSGVIG